MIIKTTFSQLCADAIAYNRIYLPRDTKYTVYDYIRKMYIYGHVQFAISYTPLMRSFALLTLTDV